MKVSKYARIRSPETTWEKSGFAHHVPKTASQLTVDGSAECSRPELSDELLIAGRRALLVKLWPDTYLFQPLVSLGAMVCAGLAPQPGRVWLSDFFDYTRKTCADVVAKVRKEELFFSER